MPWGGLRISAQLEHEVAASFPGLVAASLDVLLILSKPPPDLWVLALGLDSWLLTGSNRARFRVQGEKNDNGNIQVLGRGAYTNQ